MDLVVQTADFPMQGETTLGELFTTVSGGKGANQAVAAARLGGDVHMVGNVGDDSFGKELLENLEGNSVNSEGVAVTKGTASGIANILLSDGDNRIIVIPGANYELTPAQIDAMTEKIKISDLVLLQLEIPVPTIMHTLKLCRALNVPVLMNPAPAGGFLKEFLPYIKYLTPNETECEQIFGADLESALESFPNQLVVTLGCAGARFFDGEKHISVKAFKSEVVDTTGAGDTFNGALAYAIVEGFNLEEAVRFANTAGSLAVEKFGAQGGMPSRQEIERRLGSESR